MASLRRHAGLVFFAALQQQTTITIFPTFFCLGAAFSATHYSVADQELADAEVYGGGTGTAPLNLNLALGEWSYTGPSTSFNSRVFDQRLPGPTIRVKRGQTVSIAFQNNLPECSHPGTFNALRDVCVTNLHTHGLHISGNSPEDNVGVEIGPGGSHTYTYAIPENHLGGTLWYHPHHHGSTANHVGAGASGALIVEDDAAMDNLPPALLNIPEKVIVMTAINTNIATVDGDSGGSLISTNPSAELLLFNGMTTPRISWPAGTWLRLRMILSSVQHYVVLSIPSGCTAYLLAKDGVWLKNTGARQVSQVLFHPGNRNDVAVRCSTQGGPYALATTAGRRRLDADLSFDSGRSEAKNDLDGDAQEAANEAIPIAYRVAKAMKGVNTPRKLFSKVKGYLFPSKGTRHQHQYENHKSRQAATHSRKLQGGRGRAGAGLTLFPSQTVANFYAVVASGNSTGIPSSETLFSTTDDASIAAGTGVDLRRLTMPSYLADLTSATADETFAAGITLRGGGGCEFNCGAYEMGVILRKFSVNKIQEFTVDAGAHPFHMHVNHMQIVTSEEDPLTNWHRVGDWVDTYGGAGTVRFRSDRYTGPVVMHCHLLQHEDEGCMAVSEIVKDVGNEWGYCFNTAYEPTVLGLLASLIPLLLSPCLLSSMTNRCWHSRCCRCSACCRTEGGRWQTCINWCRKETKCWIVFTGFLQVVCLVFATLVIVNDGYGGIVELFHRNADDYYTGLAISIPCFLLVLGCAVAHGVLVVRGYGKMAYAEYVQTTTKVDPVCVAAMKVGGSVTEVGDVETE
eukprot:TRINITY_DN54775_c0_g1_i1.p1 TRINITY_DN54775_c0_g1~~TRINITY_DN54775_c0_g1_i1.p1  ORF type:complete len:796 (+),score=65.50 TRINITY_DN54775_c0_g1_i1:94-2481(+)